MRYTNDDVFAGEIDGDFSLTTDSLSVSPQGISYKKPVAKQATTTIPAQGGILKKYGIFIAAGAIALYFLTKKKR